MTCPLYLCSLLFILGGVFGDPDEVTVSVMKGESLTLPIKPEETQRNDRLFWTFNSEETAIASLDKETSKISYNDDARFKDRLQLDVVSGSLTIRDSRTTDSGVYKLEIIRKSGGPIYKRFRVTVSDEVITMSEGDSVPLRTDVNLQTDAVIQWKFKGDIIADLTGRVYDERFTNSEVNKQTGDLNITNIRTDQSGDYELEINSRGLIILHRAYRVYVGMSPGKILTIAITVGVAVGVAVAAVIVGGVWFYYRGRNLRGTRN